MIQIEDDGFVFDVVTARSDGLTLRKPVSVFGLEEKGARNFAANDSPRF